MISWLGRLCARTDSTAAHVSWNRFWVCAQMTTEMPRLLVTLVLADVSRCRHRRHGKFRLGSNGFAAHPGSAAPVRQRFGGDHFEDPPAVEYDTEIARAVHPALLVTRYFLHPEARPGGADIHHGLYLKPEAIEVQLRQHAGPECVISVAQICIPGAQGHVHHAAERPVAQPPVPGDVVAAATAGEAGPLGVVRAGQQGRHEPDYLVAVGRAVPVDHHDDVAGAGGEASPQRIALARADLVHDLDFRVALFGHGHGVVYRPPVDQYDFTDPLWQRGEDDRQVPRLVLARDDHADRRGNGKAGINRPVLAMSKFCGIAARTVWADGCTA